MHICRVLAVLEGRLAVAEGALQGANEERQVLGIAIGTAAQRYQAQVPPEAPLSEQLGSVLTASREWIPRAVHFSVHTAFSIFVTHYEDVDFPVVSTGFVLGYSEEKLAQIRAATGPPADVLAVRYEEEALPKEGEN